MKLHGLLTALLGVVGWIGWVAAVASVASLGWVRAAGAEEPDPFELEEVEYVLLDDVHPGVGGEALVDVYFRALTRYRLPVPDLRAVDVALLQDGRRVGDRRIVSLDRVDRADLGIACVVALDTSRTMMGRPFEDARKAALGLVERLRPADRAAVLAFSDRVEEVAGFDAGPDEMRAALEKLQPHTQSMSTRLYDAVYEAMTLVRGRPSLPRRVFAVVYSDGRDGGSARAAGEVVALAQGGPSEPRIPIFTIGYTGRGEEGLAALRRLSSRTGADSTRAVDLAEFYDDVLDQIRHSYVLRFESPMDGAPHEIQIDVDGHADHRLAAYPAVFRTHSRTWSPALAMGTALVLVLGVVTFGGLRTTRRMGRLRFVEGPRAGEQLALRGSRVRIGALEENDVALPVRSVSRYHAEIQRVNGEVTLIDLDSTNGTRLNGERIRRATLSSGDRIRVGEVELVYEA